MPRRIPRTLTPRLPLEIVLDKDGVPPCVPADDCPTCRLFLPRLPGESWAQWARRVAGPGR